MKTTFQRMKSLVFTIACCAVLGCGPGPVEEDETWMLGVFSWGAFPCDTGRMLHRYEVFEDGRFDIAIEDYGYVFNYRARWEQHGPGRIRVTRDGEPGDPDYHPIPPGYELEITQSRECGFVDGYHIIRHDMELIRVEDGDRSTFGWMTPGALCMETNESVCFLPEVHVYWCDGPPPECNEDG